MKLTVEEKIERDKSIAEVESALGVLESKGFIVEGIMHVGQVYEAVGQPVCFGCIKKAADKVMLDDTYQKAIVHALVEELDRMKENDEGC
jgi:hypothetical protein